MNERLYNQIAKKYQPAIKDIYKDEDGYWCQLDPDGAYRLDGYYSEHIVHEDTMKEIKAVLRNHLVAVTS